MASNFYDPEQNERAGAHYLSDLLTRFGSNLELALAAYNAGEDAVERYGCHWIKRTQARGERALIAANAGITRASLRPHSRRAAKESASGDETLSLETVLQMWQERSAPVMQALKQWVDELLAGAGGAICHVAPAQRAHRRAVAHVPRGHEVIPT